MFGQTEKSQSERMFLLHRGRVGPALEWGGGKPGMVHNTHSTNENLSGSDILQMKIALQG